MKFRVHLEGLLSTSLILPRLVGSTEVERLAVHTVPLKVQSSTTPFMGEEKPEMFTRSFKTLAPIFGLIALLLSACAGAHISYSGGLVPITPEGKYMDMTEDVTTVPMGTAICAVKETRVTLNGGGMILHTGEGIVALS